MLDDKGMAAVTIHQHTNLLKVSTRRDAANHHQICDDDDDDDDDDSDDDWRWRLWC